MKILKIGCNYFASQMNVSQKVSEWEVWGLICLNSVVHHPGYILGLTEWLLRNLLFR